MQAHVTGCSFVPSEEAAPRLADSRGSDVTKLMLDALRGFALRVPLSQAKARCPVTSKWCFWPRARMRRKIGQEPYPGLSMTPAKFGCRFATSTAVRGRQSSQALRVKTAGVQTENRLGERFVLGSTPRNRGAPFVDRAAPKVGPRGSHPTIASAKPKWPSSAGSTTSSTTA